MDSQMVCRLARWLCPTELDRARMLDSSVRMQRARMITAVAVGLALVYLTPRYGLWTLALFAVALLTGIAALALPYAAGAPVYALLSAATAALLARAYLAWRLQKRLGGYTGDCLGALQQISELAFYLGLLAAS